MTIKYSKDHEWIDISDHLAATVGITLHAQDALGDVVFVELPEVGKTYAKGEVAGQLIECWLHGSQFDMTTGEPKQLPATVPIAVHTVTLDGDDVYVTLAD